jgi:hypothetical protein
MINNNLHSINESLRKVLLLMNYDNKKTLSENVEVINEQAASLTKAGLKKGTGRTLRKSAGKTVPKSKVGDVSKLTPQQKTTYENIVKKWQQSQKKAGKTNMNPGQGTRERFIKHIEGGGTAKNFNFNARTTTSNKTKVLKPKAKKNINNKVKQASKEAGQIALREGWNWKRWLKWGVGLGIGAGIVWWLLYDDEEILLPDDMPEEQPTDNNQQGGSPSKYKQCQGPEFSFYCINKEWIVSLQNCIGAKPDGYFGPKTLAALKQISGFENFTENDKITTEQIKSICNPTQSSPQQSSEPEQEEDPFGEYEDDGIDNL